MNVAPADASQQATAEGGQGGDVTMTPADGATTGGEGTGADAVAPTPGGELIETLGRVLRALSIQKALSWRSDHCVVLSASQTENEMLHSTLYFVATYRIRICLHNASCIVASSRTGHWVYEQQPI